jgi:hypothetical protein
MLIVKRVPEALGMNLSREGERYRQKEIGGLTAIN